MERFADTGLWYKILGVRAEASEAEIRSAYRGLLKVWHPDRFVLNSEEQDLALEKTKIINEAYEKARFLLNTQRAGIPKRDNFRMDPKPPQAKRSARPGPKPRNPFVRNHESQRIRTNPFGRRKRSRRGLRVFVWVVAAGIVVMLLNLPAAVNLSVTLDETGGRRVREALSKASEAWTEISEYHADHENILDESGRRAQRSYREWTATPLRPIKIAPHARAYDHVREALSNRGYHRKQAASFRRALSRDSDAAHPQVRNGTVMTDERSYSLEMYRAVTRYFQAKGSVAGDAADG
ncbi:MAG: hypothetical protein Kow0099_08230 [Candidatus Abyssubacteria bacterium]